MAFLLTAFFLLFPVRKYLGPRYRVLEATHPATMLVVTLLGSLAVLGLLYSSLRTYTHLASAAVLGTFVVASAFPFLRTAVAAAREDNFSKEIRAYIGSGTRADEGFRERLATAASQNLHKDHDVLAANGDRLSRLLQLIDKTMVVPSTLGAEARVRFLQARLMQAVMRREGVYLPDPVPPPTLGPEEQAIYTWAVTAKELQSLPTHLALGEIRQSTEIYKALSELGAAGMELFDQQEEIRRRREKSVEHSERKPLAERLVEEALREAQTRADAERQFAAEEERMRRELSGKYSDAEIKRIVANARDTLSLALDKREQER